ncbi:uncharacterized protein JCM10292_000940 [Rhodotorula paludigena]|uniref:uncharacterized protein n=1 Tax=Rhodotorula paludigena TaxID=86838 RepID=UPI003173E3BF
MLSRIKSFLTGGNEPSAAPSEGSVASGADEEVCKQSSEPRESDDEEDPPTYGSETQEDDEQRRGWLAWLAQRENPTPEQVAAASTLYVHHPWADEFGLGKCKRITSKYGWTSDVFAPPYYDDEDYASDTDDPNVLHVAFGDDKPALTPDPECSDNVYRSTCGTMVMKLFFTSKNPGFDDPANEADVYRHLQEVKRGEGQGELYPEFLGIFRTERDPNGPPVGNRIIIMRWLGDKTGSREELDSTALRAAVDRLHSLGVAHGDLRRGHVVRNALGGFGFVDFREASLLDEIPDADVLEKAKREDTDAVGREGGRLRGARRYSRMSCRGGWW